MLGQKDIEVEKSLSPEHEFSIDPKPEMVTERQWAALRRMHWGLGHPRNTQMERQLRKQRCFQMCFKRRRTSSVKVARR